MRKIVLFLLLVVTGVILFVSCNESAPGPTGPQAISQDSMIKKGEYLVMLMGCNHCHSPKVFGPMGPVPDTTRLLSGHPSNMPLAKFDTATAKNWALFNVFNTAVVGPWGVSFSANLTSDSTGIGNWTEAQFFKAMREGKFKGLDNTRPILPPMPWKDIGSATDDDLKAIFAYLKSTKPVNNVVPAAILGPPPPPPAK